MTGSGKTRLLPVIAEEALSAGIPTLIIDIKGDLPNPGYTRLGTAPAEAGTLYSRANVESFGATVRGSLFTQGTYTPHNRATVTGTSNVQQVLTLPAMPAAATTAVTGTNVTVSNSVVTGARLLQRMAS
jgi:hypothetical protein